MRLCKFAVWFLRYLRLSLRCVRTVFVDGCAVLMSVLPGCGVRCSGAFHVQRCRTDTRDCSTNHRHCPPWSIMCLWPRVCSFEGASCSGIATRSVFFPHAQNGSTKQQQRQQHSAGNCGNSNSMNLGCRSRVRCVLRFLSTLLMCNALPAMRPPRNSHNFGKSNGTTLGNARFLYQLRVDSHWLVACAMLCER